MKKPKKKKVEKSATYIGWINIDCPEMCILLICNTPNNKVFDFLKNGKSVKLKASSMDELNELLTSDTKNFDGFYSRLPSGLRVMWLDKFYWTSDCIDTVMHECFHLVDFEAEYRRFDKEPEFKAYLHETVTKKIRNTLRDLIYKKKKK